MYLREGRRGKKEVASSLMQHTRIQEEELNHKDNEFETLKSAIAEEDEVNDTSQASSIYIEAEYPCSSMRAVDFNFADDYLHKSTKLLFYLSASFLYFQGANLYSCKWFVYLPSFAYYGKIDSCANIKFITQIPIIIATSTVMLMLNVAFAY